MHKPLIAVIAVVFVSACATTSSEYKLWDVGAERSRVDEMLDAHDSFVLEDRLVEASGLFYQPPVWVDTGWPHAAQDFDEVAAIFRDQQQWMQARGLAHSTPLDRAVHILSPSAAVVTQTFRQTDASGASIDTQVSAVTYLLIKLNSEWRITAVLRHHPDQSLASD